MNALAGSKIQSEKLIAAMLPSYHKYTNANSRIPCKAQTHLYKYYHNSPYMGLYGDLMQYISTLRNMYIHSYVFS